MEKLFFQPCDPEILKKVTGDTNIFVGASLYCRVPGSPVKPGADKTRSLNPLWVNRLKLSEHFGRHDTVLLRQGWSGMPQYTCSKYYSNVGFTSLMSGQCHRSVSNLPHLYFIVFMSLLFFTYDLFIVYIAATVFALHLGKMTAIMSSVLKTLVTNDINAVNRVKSDTDGEYSNLRCNTMP